MRRSPREGTPSRPRMAALFRAACCASVDRLCAGHLALHMASTVRGCGLSATPPLDSESCPNPPGLVWKIRRLRTLKMRVSGFVFRDLPPATSGSTAQSFPGACDHSCSSCQRAHDHSHSSRQRARPFAFLKSVCIVSQVPVSHKSSTRLAFMKDYIILFFTLLQ
jgi:hypothetical protein